MTREAEFHVTGMSCTGCARSLKERLTSVSGVRGVDVRFDDARAILSVDHQFVPAAAQAAAAVAGFTLTPVTAR